MRYLIVDIKYLIKNLGNKNLKFPLIAKRGGIYIALDVNNFARAFDTLDEAIRWATALY